ncbi:MAG: amidohydrolase family protein [Rubrivivax sp.]|nr:amidohydrolase family protein [Rubrivivax sp.]
METRVWRRRARRAGLLLGAAAGLVVVAAAGWLGIGLARPLDPIPLFGAAHAVIAITDVTVVDADAGLARPGQTVLIEAGRIRAVGAATQTEVPAGAHRVDGRGRYLAPGLWDAHLHTLRHPTRVHFPLLLAHGITSVRNMGDGCSWNTDLACMPDAREWAQQGEGAARLVPHLAASATFHVEELPPAGQAAALITALKARGDSFLKLQLPEGTDVRQAAALIAEAARQGLPAVGHVPAVLDLMDPAAGSCLSVEHGDQLLNQCKAQAAARGWPAGDCSPLLQHLARQGTAFVPTFVASTGQDLTLGSSPEAEAERLAYAPGPLATVWRLYRVLHRAGMDDESLARVRQQHAAAQQLTLAAHLAGVPVLAGTDALDPFVMHGLSLADELEQLVAAGLSAPQALRAATTAPARHSGAEDLAGRIAPGLQANLVLLSADPLRDIAAVRRIDTVFARGWVFDAAALAELKRFAAQQARSHALAARMWWAMLGG